MPEMMQDVPMTGENELRDIAEDLVEKGAIPSAEGYVRDRTYDLGLGVEVIPGSQYYDERVGWVEDVRLPSGKIVSHLIPGSHEYQEWEDPGLWVGGPADEGAGGGPKLGGVEPIGGYPPVGGIKAPPGETPLTEAKGGIWDWLRQRWYSIFGEPEVGEVEELVIIPGQMTRVMFPDGTVEFRDYKNFMLIDEVTAMEMYADYQAERPMAEAGMPIVARWEVVEDQGERFYVGYDAQGNIIETQYLGSAPTAEMTEWQKEQIDLRERERKDAIQQDRRRREQELELAELSRLPPEISEYQQGMLDLQQQEFEWRQQQDGQLSPWQEEQLRLSREQLEWQQQQFGEELGWQQQQFGELSAWQQEQMGLEQQQFGELSAWQQAQMGLEEQQFGELSAWQQAQIGLEEQQFGELSAWQEAQKRLEEQELAWRREQHGTLSAWQQEQLRLAREELALEQKNYLAGLAAQPHSWLEYSMAAGETPVIQPWMLPLMSQEYEELGAGAPIPGWQGMPAQAEPSAYVPPASTYTAPSVTQPPAAGVYQQPQAGAVTAGRYRGYIPALPGAYQGQPTGVTGPPTYDERRLFRDLKGRGLQSGQLTPEAIQQMRQQGWRSGEPEAETYEERKARYLAEAGAYQPAGAQQGRVRNMQYGGWVTKPTVAKLGEKEPELVTPLSQMTLRGRLGGGAQTGFTGGRVQPSNFQGRGFFTNRNVPGHISLPRGASIEDITNAFKASGRVTPQTATGTTGGYIGAPPITPSTTYGGELGAWQVGQMPKLARPARQYQARMGPTAFGQYTGYEQMRTGIRPEELEFRLWSMAPPGGRHRGLTYMR